MKVVTVIGARPQYVKAAPVSRALAAAGVTEVLADTGQHHDDNLSRVFIEDLRMTPPAYVLDIAGGSHAEMTGRMLPAIEQVLDREGPEAVLVYGDTNSTLAAALTAAKKAIPIVHVEAGLRSFQAAMPEEINRRTVDHLSSLLFCPTQVAFDNLSREGIGGPFDRLARQAHIVGDVMVDALRLFSGKAPRHPVIAELAEASYVLVTAHRAETTANPALLSNLVRQLADLAADLPVVCPLHPRTRHALADLGELDRLTEVPNLRLLEPLGYLDFSATLKGARTVITDSGGIQKEAAIVGVPCLTLRNETEWLETVESGWNRLIGRQPETLVSLVQSASPPSCGPLTVYGDGYAAKRIADCLSNWECSEPIAAEGSQR